MLESGNTKMMASGMVLSRDIVVEGDYITQIQFPVYSNPVYYSAFHVKFTQANQIYSDELNENAWGGQTRLKIYGIN